MLIRRKIELSLLKKNNIAIFDNIDIRKCYVEIEGQRYPRDAISINYTENDYIDQYRDLKIFFKKYIGEPILNHSISYPDIKTNYSNGLEDLRHQPDHITSKRIKLFQDYRTDPDNAKLFLIIIKRRETELISDGNKVIELKGI